MRAAVRLVLAAMFLGMAVGCTKITEMTPESGPPGTPVMVKCCNTFGDPSAVTIFWDGKKLGDSFCGSFVVPECEPGVHTVMVQDDLDANEAFLIFPVLRGRWARAKFEVTEPLAPLAAAE